MLIKRNVYFSQIDENGEERLFSTTDVESNDKLKTAGKVAMGAGTIATTAGLGSAHLGRNKILKEATNAGLKVEKCGGVFNPGIKGNLRNIGSINKLANNHSKLINGSKLGVIGGIGLTALGATAYGASKLKERKAKNFLSQMHIDGKDKYGDFSQSVIRDLDGKSTYGPKIYWWKDEKTGKYVGSRIPKGAKIK